MDSATRQTEILGRLRVDGHVDVAALATSLGTSEMTIRRDLDTLAESGALRRVRGGAISLMTRGEELPFGLRAVEASATKGRMAAVVAGLLRDGEAVVVDSGTTGLAVARAVAGRRLTVMPLSVHALPALSADPATTLLVPGGTARFGEGSLVGPMTEAALRGLRFDTVVLTCCGFSARDGVMAYDVQDAAVKRAAVESADRVVLVAEAAKFARSALVVVCPASSIDVLVTDEEAPADAVAALTDAGVDVLRA
ncbi:DeoR/GlpR family DNA-binding transcription regulator [Blastococcus tunisiensis]|uniref:DNA-binding transcriptional regulator of sugar metabolism, DeoR/GlpR family n=1 Tax=Blastococcus tunisiensis TaxID=1798228 RepID=A0A1I2M4W7_9ACTN|nr:DeoR/GlpR family DNA-binding transcription regulator [Blastococcus sp. DSM 46838]SFF86515.1 DNA-binding transcriptional regulator of sugar metabolism, DeoR/GlpR family [Blastococcus sp. DSM 46838]